MSHHVLKPPPRAGVPVLESVAALLVFTAAVALAWGFARPINVSVDGRFTTVRSGYTVSDLQHEGMLRARGGALRSVSGAVLTRDGGDPPLITRNGRPVSLYNRVYDGDVLMSRPGVDLLEPALKLRRPIPFQTRVEGKGPVMRMANPGAVGVREVTKGKVSGLEVADTVLQPAVDMVIMRTRPMPTEKLVALTFDDGPWLGQTEKILDILKSEGVHGTFFMLGNRAKAHPEIAKRVVAEGNLVGNHTYGHRKLTASSPEIVHREIAYGISSIQDATGVRPAWFRPPYGAIDASVWAQTRALRMRVALWDVDTRDWAKPGVASIVANADKNARRGSIILMHDGGGTRDQTIAALPIVIRHLKARGFVFVTLDELTQAP